MLLIYNECRDRRHPPPGLQVNLKKKPGRLNWGLENLDTSNYSQSTGVCVPSRQKRRFRSCGLRRSSVWSVQRIRPAWRQRVASYRLRRSSVKLGRLARRKKHRASSIAGPSDLIPPVVILSSRFCAAICKSWLSELARPNTVWIMSRCGSSWRACR